MPGKAMVAATEATLTTAPPLPADAAGTHGQEGVLDAERRAEQVDLELAPHRVRVEVDEQAGDLDAGVVDEDVQTAELAGRVGDGRRPARVVGHVEVDEAVALAERLGDLGAEVVLHVRDDDVRAGGGQRLGHPLAESLCPTRDQGLAPGQVENRHTDSFVEAAWSRHGRLPPHSA